MDSLPARPGGEAAAGHSGASQPEDELHMDQALALAELGRGQTSPNPMVGAVVVSEEGAVVGTGYHRRAGAAHAEVVALEVAASRARGGTLYCTLEPCSHYGRTGPCTARIVEAGIQRVVVGAVDPNPRMMGSGIDYLRERGVRVDVGVRGRTAERLNEAFRIWITQGRPFVTMKAATSRDGKISARAGQRTPLTSDRANQAIHQMRAEVDAIGVGSTTLLVDDPVLTARGAQRRRPLARVVFDRRLRTPVTAKVVGSLCDGPVIIMTTEGAVSGRPDLADQLREAGVRLETMPDDDAGIEAALRRLGSLEVTSLVLEGGVTIHRAAWEADVVDRVQQFVAPIEIGPDGVSWLELAWTELGDRVVRQYGPDTLTEGYVQRAN